MLFFIKKLTTPLQRSCQGAFVKKKIGKIRLKLSDLALVEVFTSWWGRCLKVYKSIILNFLSFWLNEKTDQAENAPKHAQAHHHYTGTLKNGWEAFWFLSLFSTVKEKIPKVNGYYGITCIFNGSKRWRKVPSWALWKPAKDIF